MKGIILAGGSGTRLYPITRGVCKQLLPVYDKPMIYYPLSVLMLAGIKDILIISTPGDLAKFTDIFGNGDDLGLNFSYRVQPHPRGLAEAFILGEEFIGPESVCLVLGDNIFFGHGLTELLRNARGSVARDGGGVIFGYYVNDPERYGIVEFDSSGNVLSVEEKPRKPKSHYAVTGLYFFDNEVIAIAKSVKPSWRGELEITDIINAYRMKKRLRVELMGRGYAWLDTGTHESLLEAGEFIATIEKRQGLKTACIEEIAYKLGYIDKQQLLKAAGRHDKNAYGEYLKMIADQGVPNAL
ncbi:MAG TPA: glucose-1-phosphate thymidylyltransferase [Nitrospiraceae bacterium]|nr:glucose-1-phosphate thymidylyltransferase [Nitrospiraceae bacterium]